MHIAHWCNYSNDKLVEKTEHLEFLATFHQGYSQIHEYLGRAICGVGAVANLAFVLVLLRPSMRSPINVLLLFIALCDLTTMIFYFAYNMVEYCNHRSLVDYYWAIFILVYANLSVAAHSLSLWLTVLMAVVRYLIIKRNRSAGDMFNKTKTSVVCAAILTVCLLLACMPNMLRNQIHTVEVDPIECSTMDYAEFDFDFTAMDETRLVPKYEVNPPVWWSCSLEKLNFWMAGILFKIIPCILLSVFMGLLIQSLFQAKKRHQRLITRTESTTNIHDRTTVMLILIVLVFLITELPQGILVLTIAVDMSGLVVYWYVGDILDLLSLLNSCVNFVLYCSMSEQFRKQFLLTFGCGRFVSDQRFGHNDQSAKAKTESVSDGERIPMIPVHSSNGVPGSKIGDSCL